MTAKDSCTVCFKNALAKVPASCVQDARIGHIQDVLVFETLRIIIETMTESVPPVGRHHIHAHHPHCLVPPTHPPCHTRRLKLAVVVVYPLPWPLLVGGVRCSRLWSTSQLLRPSDRQCNHSGGVCPQIQGVTMWCVCGCSWRDDMCRVCGCYRGGIVVMDVFWRQLCVSKIWGREICLFWVGQGCDEWGGEVSLQSC